MTRFNGTTYQMGPIPETPDRVTVLHRQGDTWRVLTVERQGSRIRVGSHRSIAARADSGSTPGSDEQGELAAVLADADRLVVVLPGGSVVCRTITLPEMEDDVRESALQLQAEGALPSTVDSHRRAAAFLPWMESLAGRMGLAVGWPGKLPSSVSVGADNVTFAPQSACLIELLALGGTGDDLRTDDGLVCYADAGNGSVELALHASGRVIVRTTRISASNGRSQEAIERIITETCLGAGLDLAWSSDVQQGAADLPAADEQALLMSHDRIARCARAVIGAPAEQGWWSQFGVAVGAAAGALGPRRALFELLDEPATEAASLLLTLAFWLSNRRRASWLLAACLLLTFLLPLASAAGRHLVLRWKAGDISSIERWLRANSQDTEFYRLLGQHRWPVTKLLADLCGASPPSIQFETIRLTPPDEDLYLKGTLPDDRRDDFFIFVAALEATGIFRDVRPSMTNVPDGMQFEIQAKVFRPLLRAEPANHYDDEPLSVILYGPDARDQAPGNYIVTRTGFGSGRSGLGAGRIRPDRSNAGGEGETGPDRRARGRTSSGASEMEAIKAPLSVEAISSMDREQLREPMRLRAKYKSSKELDETTRTRIRDEYNALLNRFKELMRQP